MRPLWSVLLALALLGGCAKSNDAAHTDHSTTVAGAQTSTTVAGASTTSGPSTTIDHAHSDAGSTTTAFSRAKASAKIDLDLVDFSFVGMPAQASGPTLFFTAVNKGPSEHEIVIADQDGKELAAVKPFAKGDKRDLAVELQPGTYVIQCLVKQGDQTHAQLGMKNTFVVS